MDIHLLLSSSCCSLNTNTAITRQLIRTARTLEAEWWQVCGEVWVRGRTETSQVLGVFGLLDFTMLRPVLAWRAFWNLWTLYFFNFPFFFRAAVNRGYGGPPVCIHKCGPQASPWRIMWPFCGLKLASPDQCYPRGFRILGAQLHQDGVYDVETHSSDMKLYL